MPSDIIKILIVDDHALIRKAVQHTIKAAFNKYIVEVAENADVALKKFESTPYDLVITDIQMPKVNGLQLTKKLLEINRSTKIIVVSMHMDVAYIQEAMEVGAKGYISKLDSEQEIVVAIKDVLEGKTYYGTKTSQQLVKDYFNSKDKRLTSKEIEVVKHIADGLVYKEIADMMDVSVRTVESHRKNILEKLEFTTNADIIKYAIKHNITS